LLSSCSASKTDGKYKVGIVQLVEHPALDAATDGFKQALIDELGKDGVSFDYQNAQNDANTCATIVNQFVSNNVNLIMANATPALQAAAAATDQIPILGTSVTEYGVALGIKDFNGTVGTNISGTSDLAPLTEQAQMMIDTLSLKSGDKVGLLYCSAEANSTYQVAVVKEYLTGKGIACTEYSFADSNDLTSVATKAASECKAIYVPTDNTVADNAGIIKNASLAKKVPVFAGEEGICAGCGYATLSIDYYNLGKKTGEMAAKILLGKAHIEDMAIEYDANPTKKYNKEICDALGIDTAKLEAAGYVAIGK
jgi:putative ABC transport system substrate-binding protein